MIARLCLLLTTVTIVFTCQGENSRSVFLPTTSRTVVRITQASADEPLRELVRIGQDNRLPLGLVLGKDSGVIGCRSNLGLLVGQITVGQLITQVNLKFQGYHAELDDGVIDVVANELSPGGKNIVEMLLPEFKTNRDTYALVGYFLWTYVRAVVAPDAATGFAGADSTGATLLKPLDIKNKSVRQILNHVVAQGAGAVWVFHDPNVVKLTEETTMPFEIHEYTGSHDFTTPEIKCSP